MKKGRKALILSLSIAASALLAPVIASAEIDITVAPPAARKVTLSGAGELAHHTSKEVCI